MLHIHKVAELTGITVRTLRYYDQIGLITPASKTEGGHRLYTSEEMKKLQQVQFLKHSGFSLKEIKQMLDAADWNWRSSLENQLAFVQKEQEKLERMKASLTAMLHGMTLEDDEGNALYNLMQLSSHTHENRKRYREKLLDKTEISLLKKVPNMSDGSADTEEWIGLLNQIRQQMHEGIHSPRIQQIIGRMDEKRLEVFADENDFTDKLWHIRMSPEKSEKFGLYPLEQSLLVFLEQAYTVYKGDGE